MKEEWRNITGFEGLYQCSSEGRMKSLDRFDSRGRKIRGKILKTVKDKDGYLYVGLSKNSSCKRYSVHRLVAEAFLDNPDNLPEVNHKDEDKTNNSVENLEFCEHKYNVNYGSCQQRRAGKLSKPVYQYSIDGNFIKVWQSTREIERQLGYASGHISCCCLGKYKTAYGYVWRYYLP